MVFDGKTTYTFFFSLIRRCIFFFNERLLDNSSCNFGLRLTTEYFRGRGQGGGGKRLSSCSMF